MWPPKSFLINWICQISLSLEPLLLYQIWNLHILFRRLLQLLGTQNKSCWYLFIFKVKFFRMARENSGSHSFQKLLFLIRDCPFGDEVSGNFNNFSTNLVYHVITFHWRQKISSTNSLSSVGRDTPATIYQVLTCMLYTFLTHCSNKSVYHFNTSTSTLRQLGIKAPPL